MMNGEAEQEIHVFSTSHKKHVSGNRTEHLTKSSLFQLDTSLESQSRMGWR
jgi:hypothetical protein